ncbi:MAG: WYL domain-containing protein [Schwartzia sp.]|nr:WYL domain-containing protein [Schwartzia sp. (in: firmicutes)]
MKVYYQDFDRREIIARILSLGSAAIVLEPEDIRDEMVERLKQAWELYKDE